MSENKEDGWLTVFTLLLNTKFCETRKIMVCENIMRVGRIKRGPQIARVAMRVL